MDQTEVHVKRVLKVLIHIEKHIDEEMTIESLSRLGCYSPFHFHRIFQAIVGETVHQYVKRLRIEKAAGRLRYTDIPVTEIAMDTSYDTPSAFTKAFKQFMGESPKNYRALYTAVNIVTKKIKELPMIQPDKIEKNIPDINVLFIRRYGNYTKSPWSAWEAMVEFMHENNIDRSAQRYFGIAHDDPKITSEDKLRFDACILAQSGIKEQGEVGHQVIKGGKYAIFIHYGSYDGLDTVFYNIFLKWLANGNESYDDTRFVFCEYFKIEYVKTDPDKLVTQLFIPLK